MADIAKNIKKRNQKKPAKETLYFGLSIPFLALMGLTIVILCNWLIDFQQLFETALHRLQEKPIDRVVGLADKKLPPAVKSGWFSISKTKLKKLDWSESLMNLLGSQNYPVLLDDKNIKSWPLFKQNLHDIARKTNMSLDGTRWQPIPVFVLGQDREKGGMIGSPKDHPLMYTNVSLLEFISATFDNNTWLYWTGELSVWNEQLAKNGYKVKTDAPSGNDTSTGNETRFNDWRDYRVRERGITDNETEVDLWRPMLWVSHPGVTAQTHYDTQHNIFIQVQGTKRFLLFSPSTELYTYPNIHRSYRQSQVHFETTLAPEYSNLFPWVNPTNTSAIEVILHPGDVMYIPPYWQHRVESLTFSVSLSILSPSYLEASLAEIYWENVPFGEFQVNRNLRGLAVRLYLNELISSLPISTLGTNVTLAKFSADLHASRFATLAQPQKPYNKGVCFLPPDEETIELIANSTRKFASAAKNIAGLLKDVECESGIKRVFLYDYAEQLTRWAVGPEYTGSFILDCLKEMEGFKL